MATPFGHLCMGPDTTPKLCAPISIFYLSIVSTRLTCQAVSAPALLDVPIMRSTPPPCDFDTNTHTIIMTNNRRQVRLCWPVHKVTSPPNTRVAYYMVVSWGARYVGTSRALNASRLNGTTRRLHAGARRLSYAELIRINSVWGDVVLRVYVRIISSSGGPT